MDVDIDCLEYQANDEFVFYSGTVINDSCANLQFSQKSKVSNLKPIPTTINSKQQDEFLPPIIIASARAISPPLPPEVIELLPAGLRILSPSKRSRCPVRNGHWRKLSDNYDYLHDLVTCDAIQVLTSRPTPLPLITQTALSSLQDNYNCDHNSFAGESSTTNSLSSTSAMSVDSFNGSDSAERYTLNFNGSSLSHEFDDYDNFKTDNDISDNSIIHEHPMGIYVTYKKFSENNFNTTNLHGNVSPLSYTCNDNACHILNTTDSCTFSDDIDKDIMRECGDFINDTPEELQSSNYDNDDNFVQYVPADKCNNGNCDSIYDNVLFTNTCCPLSSNNMSRKLSAVPIGRPPCSPKSTKRSASPRRRFDSSGPRRREILRRSIRQNSNTTSVCENQMVKGGFQVNIKNRGESVPDGDDTKKEKNKNKSLYHYVKKLLA